MAQKAQVTKKRIMIVDDSEIDREVLKAMLEDDYEIEEAQNGFEAIEKLNNPDNGVAAMMLDVQMPGMDGFGVMKIMQILGINKPVMLITSEATKDNVQKAAKLNATAFISKPFHRELVLTRVSNLMKNPTAFAAAAQAKPIQNAGGSGQSGPASADDAIAEVIHYLDDIVKNYLKARKQKDEPFKRVSQLTNLILTKYAEQQPDEGISDEQVELATRAAYFCDFGKMFLSDELLAGDPMKGGWQEKMLYKAHTTMGGDVLLLAYDSPAKDFVDICADMCMNHHERIDGKGYPRGLKDEELTVYAQVCGMAVELEERLCKGISGGSTVDEVLSEFERTTGNFRLKVFDAYMAAKNDITNIYLMGI